MSPSNIFNFQAIKYSSAVQKLPGKHRVVNSQSKIPIAIKLFHCSIQNFTLWFGLVFWFVYFVFYLNFLKRDGIKSVFTQNCGNTVTAEVFKIVNNLLIKATFTVHLSFFQSFYHYVGKYAIFKNHFYALFYSSLLH